MSCTTMTTTITIAQRHPYIPLNRRTAVEAGRIVLKSAARATPPPPLLDIPLDIVFEIFSLVQPIDLLQLARTNKTLRRYLMNRSSAPIWAASCQQVDGLPFCPKHLSYPQYVNLAFDHHCQTCLKPQAKDVTVMWTFWARHCQNCWKNILTDDEMKGEFDGGIAKGLLPEAFHHTNVLDTPRMLRYRPNVEKFRISLNNATDDETRQACIANAQEQTMVKDHDAAVCQRWYQGFEWTRFLQSAKERYGKKDTDTR